MRIIRNWTYQARHLVSLTILPIVVLLGNCLGPVQILAPEAPSDLSADAITSSQVNLSWIDESDNEESFDIQRGTGLGYQTIASIGADSTLYTDSDLTEQTTYYYRVRAVNTSGKSDWTDDVSVTTPGIPIPAETPVLTPSGGTYSEDQSIIISSDTRGAAIYYTVDGTMPGTSTSLYENPISVAGNGTTMTIKAVTIKTGMYDSEVASETYTIDYSQVSTPHYGPVAGTYTSDQLITITTTTAGADIYYTTDGGTPTASSTLYEDAISVAGDGAAVTIKSIALKSGINDSDVASASYTIQYPHTVFFDAQGGTAPIPSSKSVVYGQAYGTLAATGRTGYTFAGWYTETGGSGTLVTSTSTVNFSGNQTLYASWTANTYTITFDSQSGSPPDPTSKTVSFGSTYSSLPTTSRTGYAFSGWWTSPEGGGSQITASSTVNIASDQTLYAFWAAESIVTFDSQGGSTPSPTAKTVYYGSTYGTLAITNRTGHYFAGWWTGPGGTGTEITASTVVEIIADQTLYAHWVVSTFTISFDAQGGTIPNPTSKTVTYGSTYGTLPSISRTGYNFSGWWTETEGAGDEIAAASPVTITDDQTLYAYWIEAGSTWTQRTMPSSQLWRSVAYGNGIYVALTTNVSDVAAYSSDGATWTQCTLPMAGDWYSVTYGNGLFVAVDYYGDKAVTSPDGINWTQRSLPVYQQWYSVTYGNGLFVAVSADGNVAVTSPDGITWTERSLPGSEAWFSVTYGNGIFVAVAYGSNAAITSPDGINWTQRTLPTSGNWHAVTFGDGLFVAVDGSYGTNAASSTDGVTWTQRTLPISGSWFSVTYGNGVFVAPSAYSNDVATSPDGITWIHHDLPWSAYWYSIAYGDGVFVTVARDPTDIAATSP